MTLPIRSDLLSLSPYGAPVADVPASLNVNENPYAPPADVLTEIGVAMTRALDSANRYPDREANALRQTLADFVGVGSPDMVWPGNGSNEVMHQLFAAFGGPGRTAISFSPTYSMYPEYARETFTKYEAIPRGSDFQLTTDQVAKALTEHRPSIVVVASPNNPTGTTLPRAEVVAISRLCQEHNAVFILDEAYIEFADEESAATLVHEHPHLVVTRTLSKAFGLASLRVGYAVASAAVVAALRIVRLPYHLSAVTQAAATAALSRAEALLAPVPGLISERVRLTEAVTNLGLRTTDSQANFVYVTGFADSHAVWTRLFDKGILVRETGPTGWLRISIGTPTQNDMVLAALAELKEAGQL